jgi:putative nucleotidyltransferase with HDIG domain
MDKPLVDLIDEVLGRGDLELQVFPPLVLKLRHLLSSDDYSMTDVANIIKKDQVLSTDLLKMANSAFYAGLTPVKTIRDAIVRLGAQSIVNLVTAITQKQLYRTHKNKYRHWMPPLWCHALGVAFSSRWLCLNLGLNRLAEESFMAGLLHDIGKLLLLKAIEDVEESELSQRAISNSLIHDILENMHTKHGSRLMEHLNMPEVYAQVVGRHHDPEIAAENIILNVVRLGDLACHKVGIGTKHDPGIMLSTTPEAVSLMAKDLALAELQVVLEEYMESTLKVMGDR